MPLSIDVPEDLLQAVKLPPGEVPNRLKRELAIRLCLCSGFFWPVVSGL